MGKDVLYIGRILSFSVKKQGTLKVAYWKYEEEDDAEDSNVTLIELLTDLVLGDLTFCSNHFTTFVTLL